MMVVTVVVVVAVLVGVLCFLKRRGPGWNQGQPTQQATRHQPIFFGWLTPVITVTRQDSLRHQRLCQRKLLGRIAPRKTVHFLGKMLFPLCQGDEEITIGLFYKWIDI